MAVDALIMLSGILVAVFAVLPRFPEPWQTAIFLVLGIAVFGLGVVIRRRMPPTVREQKVKESYRESQPDQSPPQEVAHERTA